ncbi:MAG TPA: polyprenyl diphosphate synthase [Candidatus Limnocylindrales bacterium]
MAVPDAPASPPAKVGARVRRAAGPASRDRLVALRRRLVDLALRPVYAVYIRRLRVAVQAYPVPAHVAVIMDGNRRWARQEGLLPGAGHRRGAEKALELLDWCAALGVREVTLWALSLENLGRTPDEIGTITDVAADALAALASGRRRTRVPVHLRVIGRAELLPERLRQVVADSSAVSRPDGALSVTIALGYSGRDELVEACRSTVSELVAAGVPAERLPEALTAEALAAHLYTRGSTDPDLIIRTSGEVRLSGFLPWQSAYSEYYFCEAHWPAFREIDFLRAIRTYQQRSRRFGR